MRETWAAQANLSFFLILLVVCVFILPLTSLVEEYFSVYADIAYSVLLISGLAIGWSRSWIFYTGVVVGVGGLAVRWLVWWYPRIAEFREVTSLAAIVILIVILLVRVFEKGPVSGSRLQGAIAAYLLLGLAWAHAYSIFALHHPQAFQSAEPSSNTVASWTYFSFTTLTTVGYGDIIPKAPAARMIAVGEALAGQLYLATLVARLVALQVTGGTGKGTAGEQK